MSQGAVWKSSIVSLVQPVSGEEVSGSASFVCLIEYRMRGGGAFGILNTADKLEENKKNGPKPSQTPAANLNDYGDVGGMQ